MEIHLELLRVDGTLAQLNQTNYFVGAWNKKFAGVVGHSHPTIWNFLEAVRMEQSATDGKIFSYFVGQQPPKRKKAYVDKNITTFLSNTFITFVPSSQRVISMVQAWYQFGISMVLAWY